MLCLKLAILESITYPFTQKPSTTSKNPSYHLNRFLDAAEPASNASCSPRSHPSVLPSCAQQVQIIPIPSSNGTKPLIRRPCQSVYGSLSQNSASSSISRLPA